MFKVEYYIFLVNMIGHSLDVIRTSLASQSIIIVLKVSSCNSDHNTAERYYLVLTRFTGVEILLFISFINPSTKSLQKINMKREYFMRTTKVYCNNYI